MGVIVNVLTSPVTVITDVIGIGVQMDEAELVVGGSDVVGVGVEVVEEVVVEGGSMGTGAATEDDCCGGGDEVVD